jgi:hypothetical protein
MEVSILPIATPQTNLAPVARADMRSTADVAALIRNPQPEIPLRIPPVSDQKRPLCRQRSPSAPMLSAVLSGF